LKKGGKIEWVQDNAVYAAMIENMDANIGRLLHKLDSLGLSDNTIIIFTSDNGGLSTAEGSPTKNGVLRAGKGWLYEGGIRVPMIIKWPSKIKAGQVSDMPICSVDIFPTLSKAINKNAVISKDVDGKDIVTLLKNEKVYRSRYLYWHYPHYSNQGGKPGAAITKNDFKLILNYEDESVELYNLKNDLAEENNIAATNKNVVASYSLALKKWLKNNNAIYPKPNPNYNKDFNGEKTIKKEEE
jgi:arylsulfatase A-like enzyme